MSPCPASTITPQLPLTPNENDMSHFRFGKNKIVYKGIMFNIHQREVTFPNGLKKMFEYCERPTSVTIMAFNDKNELMMIKEHRPGFKHAVWFLPAGMVDYKGEPPRRAAMRELREETGYAAKTLKLIQKKSPSSKLIWDIYLYAAKDLSWNPLPQDPGEFITVHYVTLKKAVAMALDGTIENEFIAYDIIRFAELLKRGEFSW